MRLLLVLALVFISASRAAVNAVHLRTEWLRGAPTIDEATPRLSWQVESSERNEKQTAFQVLVASSEDKLGRNEGDLWDSSKVASDETINVVYDGRPLESGERCFWKVKVWDRGGKPSAWSATSSWSMGLLKPADWKGEWISFRDLSPLHMSTNDLYLPPARYYRRLFQAKRNLRRATLYGSALGICDFQVNGQRTSDAFFEPGWADYLKRNYYRAHDVTALLKEGQNAIGAVVADGWYSGYVGYGLFVGYGPNKTGRCFYGKTPALLAQLELEYSDGSRETIGTDKTWEVSGSGPVREADLLMGETFDARVNRPDWSVPGGAPDWVWEPAIGAEENGMVQAILSDNQGDREVELGFQKPRRLQAYPAPPIRITAELKAPRLTEPKPGVYIFDLGQNIAGIARLKVKGPAGTKVQMRFGEMLHPDGTLMTENLRRARATDYYILSGNPNGETWAPRFTYHGFQFVELTGLAEKPNLDAITGIVLQNDTEPTGSFECSDEVMTKFWKNTTWTQRANTMEVPTDCPQRDERLGWTGDTQMYIRTATFNADVAAFFGKWLNDVEEAQRSFGAYADYAPYPFGHGEARKTFSSAWMDAGIICPWTLWHVYGDTGPIKRHWDSMTRFMEFRIAASHEFLGSYLGNGWGDWLHIGTNTPVEYVDTCYYACDARLMAEMANAMGKKLDAANYFKLESQIKTAFKKQYIQPDGSLKIKTQTACAMAIAFEMLPPSLVGPTAERLEEMLAQNGYRMTTGFLGTKALLPALTISGKHDLAARIFQSRQFPSWGYEVVNGANSVWERWDSYTEEHGFNGESGKQNAAMNSFNHYAFGSVMEWGFRDLAGIDTDGPGYKRIILRPSPPSSAEIVDVQKPLNWVKAEYDSPRGKIRSGWKKGTNRFEFKVTIPANTSATVFLPAPSAAQISESGRPLGAVEGVKLLRVADGCAVLQIGSGDYEFSSNLGR